jgi:hypothetical protein
VYSPGKNEYIDCTSRSALRSQRTPHRLHWMGRFWARLSTLPMRPLALLMRPLTLQ